MLALAIPRHNYLIDQAVCLRLIWCHEAVALGIFSDFGFRLARMAYQDIVEHISHTQNLTGVNFNLGCLPLDTPKRLMNHNSGMWQRKTLTGSPCRQQESGSTRGHANTNG